MSASAMPCAESICPHLRQRRSALPTLLFSKLFSKLSGGFTGICYNKEGSPVTFVSQGVLQASYQRPFHTGEVPPCQSRSTSPYLFGPLLQSSTGLKLKPLHVSYY